MKRKATIRDIIKADDIRGILAQASVDLENENIEAMIYIYKSYDGAYHLRYSSFNELEILGLARLIEPMIMEQIADREGDKENDY